MSIGHEVILNRILGAGEENVVGEKDKRMGDNWVLCTLAALWNGEWKNS